MDAVQALGITHGLLVGGHDRLGGPQHRFDGVAPVARAAVPHPEEVPLFDDGVVVDSAPLPRFLEFHDHAPRLGRVKAELYPFHIIDQKVVDEELPPRADIYHFTCFSVHDSHL